MVVEDVQVELSIFNFKFLFIYLYKQKEMIYATVFFNEKVNMNSNSLMFKLTNGQMIYNYNYQPYDIFWASWNSLSHIKLA